MRNPFHWLLAALVLVFVLSATLRSMGIEDRATPAALIMGGAGVLMLVAALPAIGQTRRQVAVWGIVAASALGLRVLELFAGTQEAGIAYQVAMIVFMTYIAIATFRFLFLKQKVTTNTISAALCVYLLLGVIWAFAYSLTDTLQPGSFRSTRFTEDEVLMRFGSGHSFYPYYYSLVTLTTLGYGDVIPVSRAASMLAALEAITGQIYLAVLVARLVGLHVAQQSERE